MNALMEDDLDSIFGGDAGDKETQQAAQQIAAQPVVATVYPLSLADGTLPGTTAATGIRRQIGGMPIWGWGLIAAGLGVGGWYYYQNQNAVKKNDGDEDSDGSSSSGGEEGGWSPSRSRFAEMLKRFLAKENVADKTTIYPDADEAVRAKLKNVSPLVTIVVKGPAPMKALEKFARREGLKPTQHDGGVIGFYPIQGKRGRAWEEYIDLLRDDGQKV